MIFRDLKAGFPIYLFDRASRKFKQGKVTTNPCPDFEKLRMASSLSTRL